MKINDRNLLQIFYFLCIINLCGYSGEVHATLAQKGPQDAEERRKKI